MHRGHLRIEGRAPDRLRFLDREGRDLERQHRLDVAHWLDIWPGWRGNEWDTRSSRGRSADWLMGEPTKAENPERASGLAEVLGLDSP